MSDKTIFFQHTNKNEVKSIISKLKTKLVVWINISTKVLKEISDYIAEPLSVLFNMCIDLSVWPTALKIAEVVPVFKAKEKYKVQNNRQISLISNIAKVFEKN